MSYCTLFLYNWTQLRRRGVVVISTAQLHSTKLELRFCAGSNPARGVSEICDGENLWQWSQLEIRLNAFRRSTIPQKQIIIIIIIIGSTDHWEQWRLLCLTNKICFHELFQFLWLYQQLSHIWNAILLLL